MHTSETTIFMAIVTAAIVLLTTLCFLIINMAAYQRKKRKLAHAAICDKLLFLERQQYQMAMDLHDDIGNAVASAILKLNNPILTYQGKTKELVEELQDITNRIRQVTFNLLPDNIEQGLTHALQRLITGIPIKVYLTGQSANLSREYEVQVFRIIQEWLTNSIKHSNATFIDLNISSDSKLVSVRYRDNGTGFDRKIITPGLGLRNIETRASLLNANLYLYTKPAHGTTWQLEIPTDKLIN